MIHDHELRHRYPVKWEIGSDHPLPDGITFEQSRADARDDRCLLVDDDHWTLEEATPGWPVPNSTSAPTPTEIQATLGVTRAATLVRRTVRHTELSSERFKEFWDDGVGGILATLHMAARDSFASSGAIWARRD